MQKKKSSNKINNKRKRNKAKIIKLKNIKIVKQKEKLKLK